VPPENAAYLADAIPHARAEVLADASHCPFLEQPETFNALVADFALSAAFAAQGRSGPSM
jgi:pimeloyl-ACP methyl ester carboxylesterase